MKRSPSVEQRFWSKVDRSGGPDECWPWLAAKVPDGYGQFHVRGEFIGGAHRFAYQLTFGPIADGLHLDHVCHTEADCTAANDCPHRACVNPSHLEPVSPRENFNRSHDNVGDINRRKTHCPAGHEYTEENTYWARDRAGQHRYCRTCRRERKRKTAA